MLPSSRSLTFPNPTFRGLTVATDTATAATRATPWQARGSVFRAKAAFTLVEMLVVMAVIVALLATTVPVFKNLLGGRTVEQSINSVSGLLELAHATAISKRTYVYVVFKNVTNSDNNTELRCTAVMDVNGNPYLSQSNTPSFTPITKLIKVPNVKNVVFSAMPQAVKNITPADLASDGSYIAGWYPSENSAFPSYIVGGQDFKGATYIRFDEDGEIGTSGDPYNLMVQPFISLRLATTRGTVVQANATDGAIVTTYGGSARMRIIRP